MGVTKEEGSGVILTSEGMIITNNHVVSEEDKPADTIEVTFATGRLSRQPSLGEMC